MAPKTRSRNLVHFATALLPEVSERVVELAREQDRTVSSMIARLVRLAIQAGLE
jgi:hypothetical protein